MKFAIVAASLCVLGSASAFVFPMPVRSGESELHVFCLDFADSAVESVPFKAEGLHTAVHAPPPCLLPL